MLIVRLLRFIGILFFPIGFAVGAFFGAWDQFSKLNESLRNEENKATFGEAALHALGILVLIAVGGACAYITIGAVKWVFE